jgi:hypothetical protein
MVREIYREIFNFQGKIASIFFVLVVSSPTFDFSSDPCDVQPDGANK